LSFPFYIAKRYLFAKASNNAINLISMIAMSGVIVGSAALFIILSGFSGLRTFSYSLLNLSDPDIKISSVEGKSILLTENILSQIESVPEVVNYTKVVEERVLLKNGEKEAIAYIKGVDNKYNKVVSIDSSLVAGSWVDHSYSSGVLGNGLAYKLAVGFSGFSEGISVFAPKKGTGLITSSNYKVKKIQVTGLYSGTEEFENKYLFTPLKIAQLLLDYNESQCTAVELKIQNDSDPNKVALSLKNKLGNNFNIQTKAQLNELFYKVINTENLVSYLVFTLILIIAMFNVIGAIIMMILDKKKNLNTLLSMGATQKELKQIFVIQGTLLTIVGMLIGLVLAMFLIFLQQQFNWFMITANIPYPVEFKLTNLLIVVVTLLTLGYLASKIASSRISVITR